MMDFNAEQRRHLERLKAKTRCDRKHVCIETPGADLCAARDLGMGSFLECLETVRGKCRHAFPFGKGRFCRCPLRVFLEKCGDATPP